MNIKQFLNKIINILYPTKCPCCNEIVDSNKYLCDECSGNLNPTIHKYDLFLNNSKSISIISPFLYNSDIKKVIWNFKFRGDKYLSDYLSDKIVYALTKLNIESKIDIITSVPLSKKKKSFRGYNQAEVIARDISSKLKIPYIELLKKNINNYDQHSLNAEERVDNVKGVYSAIPNKDTINKRILICDDIITTGSTIIECSRILYNSGAKDIIAGSIACSDMSIHENQYT